MTKSDTFLDRERDLYKTFREEWPSVLDDLALDCDVVRLSPENCIALASRSPLFKYYMDLEKPAPFSEGFREELSVYFDGAPKFVRLGCCSFKAEGGVPLPVLDADQAISEISTPNDRVAEFLFDVLSDKRKCALYIADWQDIPAWAEFRLFIRDRKIAGVSQYHHHDTYSEIQENLEGIKASLIPFSRKLIDSLHMETVVADVFVAPQSDGSFLTTLIELNPYIMRTDPCLYTWQNGGDFDGGIRYRKLRYNPYRNTTSAGKSKEPLELFRDEDYRRV